MSLSANHLQQFKLLNKTIFKVLNIEFLDRIRHFLSSGLVYQKNSLHLLDSLQNHSLQLLRHKDRDLQQWDFSLIEMLFIHYIYFYIVFFL